MSKRVKITAVFPLWGFLIFSGGCGSFCVFSSSLQPAAGTISNNRNTTLQLKYKTDHDNQHIANIIRVQCLDPDMANVAVGQLLHLTGCPVPAPACLSSPQPPAPLAALGAELC